MNWDFGPSRWNLKFNANTMTKMKKSYLIK